MKGNAECRLRGSDSPLRGLRIEPLRVRVGRNRIRFAVFLLAFVIGSAILLALAFVAIPGLLIGLVVDTPHYYSGLATIVAAVTGVLLVLGGMATAVQVSKAERWVRSRFDGVELDPDAHSDFARAVADMSIAGGLPEPPRLLLFDVPSANACAIDVGRRGPVIGVTQGLIDTFTPGEQQAVIATLIARITRGDILVGTAVAALMGPLRQLRVGHDNGCAGAAGMIPFVGLTWVAIVVAAVLVTAWGRALHRTGHEKADAEGMLLLRQPQPMLSALQKAISTTNEIADGDPSYDGIFYASTSGTPAIEKVERRRYDRLREVLGPDGLAAALPDWDSQPSE